MPYRLRSLILILCNSDFVEHGPWVADEKMVYPLLRELQPMGGPERIRFGDFEHLYLGPQRPLPGPTHICYMCSMHQEKPPQLNEHNLVTRALSEKKRSIRAPERHNQRCFEW